MNPIRTLILTAVVILAVIPASGQVEFTFEGFAMMQPGIDQVGATLTVYGIANPPASAPTPLPMDFVNNQYTLAVTGMVVTAFAENPVIATKDFDFQGGTIQIFGEPIIGGSAADYANTGTFTDGDMMVQAAVDDGWSMLLDNPIGFGYSGAGIGTCDLNGGSSLGDLQSYGFPTDDWTFAGSAIAEPSFFITVPAGYNYVFGVKIIFPYDPTPNADATWSQVKNLFR